MFSTSKQINNKKSRMFLSQILFGISRIFISNNKFEKIKKKS